MEARERREGYHYNSRFVSIRSQQVLFLFSPSLFVFSFLIFFLFRKQIRILGSEHLHSFQLGLFYIPEDFLSNFLRLVNVTTFSCLSSTQTETSISFLFHNLVTNFCEFLVSSSRTEVPN